MKRAHLIIGLVTLALPGHVLGEPVSLADRVKKPPEPTAKRVEVRNNRSFDEPLSKPLRPNRVYAVFHPVLERWVFTLTDGKGVLSRPFEALAPGSVVMGGVVGGDTDKRYRLTKKSGWEVTKDPLQRRIWSLGQNVEYRLYLPIVPEPKRQPASRKEPSKTGSGRGGYPRGPKG